MMLVDVLHPVYSQDKLVTLDLSPKEFFSLLHELESAKFCLQSVNSAET